MGIYDIILHRADGIEAEVQVKWVKSGFDGYYKCAMRLMIDGDHAPRGVPDGQYGGIATLTIHCLENPRRDRHFHLGATVAVRDGWTKVRINDPIPPQYARHMGRLARSIERMEAKLPKRTAKELSQ